MGEKGANLDSGDGDRWENPVPYHAVVAHARGAEKETQNINDVGYNKNTILILRWNSIRNVGPCILECGRHFKIVRHVRVPLLLHHPDPAPPGIHGGWVWDASQCA